MQKTRHQKSHASVPLRRESIAQTPYANRFKPAGEGLSAERGGGVLHEPAPRGEVQVHPSHPPLQQGPGDHPVCALRGDHKDDVRGGGGGDERGGPARGGGGEGGDDPAGLAGGTGWGVQAQAWLQDTGSG